MIYRLALDKLTSSDREHFAARAKVLLTAGTQLVHDRRFELITSEFWFCGQKLVKEKVPG